MGCGFAEGDSGYNIGRNASLLAGIDYPCRHDGQPLLCLLAADDADGVPRDQGGRGRHVHRLRRGGVSRATQGGEFEFHPKLDGSEGSLYNVYIPMG